VQNFALVLLYSTKLFELVNAQCVLVFVLSIVLCSGCQKLFIADERNLQAVTLWTSLLSSVHLTNCLQTNLDTCVVFLSFHLTLLL